MDEMYVPKVENRWEKSWYDPKDDLYYLLFDDPEGEVEQGEWYTAYVTGGEYKASV
jgi:hypothetical protein